MVIQGSKKTYAQAKVDPFGGPRQVMKRVLSVSTVHQMLSVINVQILIAVFPVLPTWSLHRTRLRLTLTKVEALCNQLSL